MAGPNSVKLTIDNYQAVVTTFSEFLVVAIHTILYERNIYPRTSFLKARKYNYPVRQSRHPKVCKWIQDAVAAVEVEMLKCHLATTSLVLISHASHPLERFVFSTASFPVIPPTEHLTSFADLNISTVDLEEQFRAIFVRLSTLFSSLTPLPEDCTFSLIVELNENAEPPIGHPQPWIPALEQGNGGNRKGKLKEGDGVRTIPGRKVEAGDFVMEMWVEEGKEKGRLVAEIEES